MHTCVWPGEHYWRIYSFGKPSHVRQLELSNSLNMYVQALTLKPINPPVAIVTKKKKRKPYKASKPRIPAADLVYCCACTISKL